MTKVIRPTVSPYIELLGIGSAKYRLLSNNLKEALKSLSLEVPVYEVTEVDDLMQYEIAGIPALAVNGQVLFQQIVPSAEDIAIVLKVLLESGGKVKKQ
ncbi:MAG: thioredoxin family protein [Phaeodactylibacter sp.]|nr:thioredoxin family protein [Phaeodactylibacter sp.]MCB9302508.1 thioredoxin family protein [Lewinellaceae bacterium]HQU57559.1 thioredoxin family protein [Saprospiraceae bacterium]